ncbi:MAG: iron-sulfur cluster assembly scaffold protein [Verrucomicrobiota bacterium]|nr:iron-sulfur cluster assembly scaffold protein [Verrucomicrobiota bacterium]
MTHSDSFEEKVREAIANPKNLGKMEDADAVGTVGGAGCGDMLRMWLKFKDQDGKKVIDKASFQSFGCETAIAAASLATELIKGKSTSEALALSGAEMAADLGPLPPTKIHCTTMVEDALRSAIAAHEGGSPETKASEPSTEGSPLTTQGSLRDPSQNAAQGGPGLRVVMLPPEEDSS